MENATLSTYSSPPKHAKALAVLYIIFGGFHACIFTMWLLAGLSLVLSLGSRGWEHEFARDAITGSSIFLPLIAVLPLITANVLLKKRRWSNTFVLVSGVVWLLYSLLILAIAFHTYAEFKDVSFLLYALPCFALSIYSFWFVVRKRAV